MRDDRPTPHRGLMPAASALHLCVGQWPTLARRQRPASASPAVLR